MQTVNSAKKVIAVTDLAVETTKFLQDFEEGTVSLKRATETIALQKTDKIYNNVVTVLKTMEEFKESIGMSLANLAQNWGSRPAISAQAKSAFEEAEAKAKGVLNVSLTATEVELSDDLHENYTDETKKAFETALRNVFELKVPYINKVVAIISENTTEDTKATFEGIGSGIEKVTNSFVVCHDSIQELMKELNMDIESIAASNRTTAIKVDEVASSAAGKIKAKGADID